MSDPATSTIFGAGTGVSYEDLVRRQAIAQALAGGQLQAPKTFGEGLYSLGNSLANALDKRYERQLAQQQFQRDQAVAANAPTSAPPAPTSAPPVDAPTPPLVPEAAPDVAPPVPRTSDLGNFDAPKAPQEIVAAIAANTPDPVLRAYANTMAAHEGGRTGSGNYFQWQPATAKQYGVTIGDPDSEARGFLNFTADNRRVLDNGLNQDGPSTPSQWAVAHQQGGGTAVKMFNGTGNASRTNLIANGANPDLTGPQAFAKTQQFYYPNGDPVDPKSTIAMTLAARPGGLAPTPPSGRKDVAAVITGQPPGPATTQPPAGNAPTPTNIQPAPNVPLVAARPDPGPEPVARRQINADDPNNQYAKVISYWAPYLANPGTGQDLLAQAKMATDTATQALISQNAQMAAEDKSKHDLWVAGHQAQQAYDQKYPEAVRTGVGQQQSIQKGEAEEAMRPTIEAGQTATSNKAVLDTNAALAKAGGLGTWTESDGSVFNASLDPNGVRVVKNVTSPAAVPQATVPQQNLMNGLKLMYEANEHLKEHTSALTDRTSGNFLNPDMLPLPQNLLSSEYNLARMAGDTFSTGYIGSHVKGLGDKPDDHSAIYSRFVPGFATAREKIDPMAADREATIRATIDNLGNQRPLWDQWLRDREAAKAAAPATPTAPAPNASAVNWPAEGFPTNQPDGTRGTDKVTGLPIIVKNGRIVLENQNAATR